MVIVAGGLLWSTKMDEIERRSRLVSLAYEVLREMETPTDEATNTAVFSALAWAFFDKATAQANFEAAPKARRNSPTVVYATSRFRGGERQASKPHLVQSKQFS